LVEDKLAIFHYVESFGTRLQNLSVHEWKVI
jgi:hypothetical protein